MSGARINNYTPSTTTLDSVIGAVDYEFAGILAISLTNYTSTTRPGICAGSIAEVAGNIFEFSTENTISTTGVTSTVACDYYVKLVPSSSECSAQFSTVVPTWRTDYQGYYENSTSVNRVVGEMYFTGADYTDKQIYFARGVMKLSYCNGVYYSSISSIIPSTLVVSMSGYVRDIVSIQLGGWYQDHFYLSSYTIQSTTVTIILDSTGLASTGVLPGSVFVVGVNY